MEESPIENVDVGDEDAHASIDKLNEDIVNQRLLKWTQINNLFSTSYTELLLTCKALKDQNVECSRKYEKLERKYIQK